ncbi:MAG: DUF4391 domain-containing protein, partial [Bacteroidia bacterium]
KNSSVIDYRFCSDWFDAIQDNYSLALRKNLDNILANFCGQLSGKPETDDITLVELIQHRKKIDLLNKEINTLSAKVKNTKQFNKKVELNMLLKKKEAELENLRSEKA